MWVYLTCLCTCTVNRKKPEFSRKMPVYPYFAPHAVTQYKNWQTPSRVARVEFLAFFSTA